MTSEIRANTLKNRVGLGTVSFTNTGPVVSGIVTATSIEVDQLEVAANNTTVGVAITQSGSGDILKLYDGTSEVFTVANQDDGVGAVTISSPKPRIVFNETNASPDYQIRMNGGIFSIHDSTNDIGRISITSSRTDINNPVLLNNDTVWIGDKLVHWTDDDTAVRFPSANTISMETAGSEVLRITSDRKVGINRTSPTRHLHAYATGAGFVAKFEGSYSYSAVEFADTGTTNAPYIGSKNDHFTIATGGNNERVRITSTGVVGIATDVSGNGSGAKLVVGGRVQSNNGGYWFADANGAENGWHVQDSGGNLIIVESGVAERLRIGSSGQIGLGGANYGSSGQVLTSGGSGSAATWSTVSGISVANQADNRLITATGTTDALNGEQRLTWDGSRLSIDCQSYQEPILINSTQSSVRATIRQTNDANANSGLAIQKRHSSLHPANYWYGDISFEGWDGSGYHKAALIECVAEGTPANDNMPGGLRFSTNAGAAGVTERLRIKPDGNVEVKTGNLVMTSGKGIDFSATGDGTGSSSRSELLDDYESGEWTGSINSGSANIGGAWYVKIGKLVIGGGNITAISDTSSSNPIIVNGLPFSNSGGNSGHGAVTASKNNQFDKMVGCYVSGTTVRFIVSSLSTGSGDYLRHSAQVQSTGSITFGFNYQTS